MATAVGSGTTYAPGSLTAAQLVRSVLDYVQGGDDEELQAVALRELNMAIDECNARLWKKLIALQTITLAASTDAYALENDFKDPQAALLDNGSGRHLRLRYEPHRTFLERFEQKSNYTNPEFYSVDYGNREFLLQGDPDSVFVSSYPTVQFYYYRRLAYLAGDGDTHGGPPEFNAFLIWQARAGLAAIRADRQLAGYAEGKAKNVYSELIRSDGNIVSDWG